MVIVVLQTLTSILAGMREYRSVVGYLKQTKSTLDLEIITIHYRSKAATCEFFADSPCTNLVQDRQPPPLSPRIPRHVLKSQIKTTKTQTTQPWWTSWSSMTFARPPGKPCPPYTSVSMFPARVAVGDSKEGMAWESRGENWDKEVDQ